MAEPLYDLNDEGFQRWLEEAAAGHRNEVEDARQRLNTYLTILEATEGREPRMMATEWWFYTHNRSLKPDATEADKARHKEADKVYGPRKRGARR
jgi:hypothetical protein